LAGAFVTHDYNRPADPARLRPLLRERSHSGAAKKGVPEPEFETKGREE
jgi:hypothetical protein